MNDNKCECAAGSCFKEAVCIDAGRIYDSCCDKDCVEDVRVYLPEYGQSIIENATVVKGKKAEVICCYIDVESVPFNSGYYSIDMTFFFEVTLEACCPPSSCSTTVTGISMFNKKVVLYGSEGNVKVFSSELKEGCGDKQSIPTKNLPRAIVQAAEPILLSVRVAEERVCDKCCCSMPESIYNRYDCELAMNGCQRVALATIGLFTIIQMERQVQMLVPVYDFCMPCKECVNSCEDPCELFNKIQFPSDQFFPPRSVETEPCRKKRGVGCGCNQ